MKIDFFYTQTVFFSIVVDQTEADI